MKDNFNIHLKKIAGKLPQYSPDERLWNNISEELDFDEKLKSKIKDLPTVNHNQDLWGGIEKQLNRNRKISGIKIRKVITWSISIAATVAIFVVFISRYSNTSRIEISEEYQLKESFIHIPNTNGEDPIDMLKQLCTYSMDKCNHPGFESEMNRLMQLDTEIKHLQNIIATYGDSPSLVKSLIAMENQKAGLVKELLKIVRT